MDTTNVNTITETVTETYKEKLQTSPSGKVFRFLTFPDTQRFMLQVQEDENQDKGNEKTWKTVVDSYRPKVERCEDVAAWVAENTTGEVTILPNFEGMIMFQFVHGGETYSVTRNSLDAFSVKIAGHLFEEFRDHEGALMYLDTLEEGQFLTKQVVNPDINMASLSPFRGVYTISLIDLREDAPADKRVIFFQPPMTPEMATDFSFKQCMESVVVYQGGYPICHLCPTSYLTRAAFMNDTFSIVRRFDDLTRDISTFMKKRSDSKLDEAQRQEVRFVTKNNRNRHDDMLIEEALLHAFKNTDRRDPAFVAYVMLCHSIPPASNKRLEELQKEWKTHERRRFVYHDMIVRFITVEDVRISRRLAGAKVVLPFLLKDVEPSLQAFAQDKSYKVLSERASNLIRYLRKILTLKHTRIDERSLKSMIQRILDEEYLSTYKALDRFDVVRDGVTEATAAE